MKRRGKFASSRDGPAPPRPYGPAPCLVRESVSSSTRGAICLLCQHSRSPVRPSRRGLSCFAAECDLDICIMTSAAEYDRPARRRPENVRRAPSRHASSPRDCAAAPPRHTWSPRESLTSPCDMACPVASLSTIFRRPHAHNQDHDRAFERGRAAGNKRGPRARNQPRPALAEESAEEGRAQAVAVNC